MGFKVLYKPTADHKTAGTVHKPDGTRLELTDHELIGWAVVPIFEGCVKLHGLWLPDILK